MARMRSPGRRGGTGCSFIANDPRRTVRERYNREVLGLLEKPSPVKTLKDMTPEERAEMERLYGRK